MPSRFAQLEIDVPDPAGAAAFWASLLDWTTVGADSGMGVVRPPVSDGCPWDLVFLKETEAKRRKNRLHLDLASGSPDHQTALVAWARKLGARPTDIGQGDTEPPWAVLADPLGTEFCVLEPRADYHGSGALAALVIDSLDVPALARFWATTIGWTIEHTSPDYAGLRAPGGRGPWLEFVRDTAARQGRNRVRPVLLPDDGEHASADPEGNEIVLLHSEGAGVSPDP